MHFIRLIRSLVVAVQVRNFSSVVVTCNNMLSREVSVFRSARVYFSIGGVHYQSPSVIIEPARDDVESVRQVVVPVVPNRLGRYVRLVLAFNLRWIMISEVQFISGRCLIATLFIRCRP